MNGQQELWGKGLEAEKDSLQMKRLTSDAERLYLEHWRRANKRHPAINSGYTTLEWILCPCGQRYPDGVSQRDANVAASVVQWFGTNCGGCFIRQVEAEIDKLRAVRSTWHRATFKVEELLSDEDNELAALIASRFATGMQARELASQIRAAMARRIRGVPREALRVIEFPED